MGIMNSFTYKDVKKKLEKLWCSYVKNSAGTHEVRYSPFVDHEFMVVHHTNKPMIVDTLMYMFECSGITKKQFLEA